MISAGSSRACGPRLEQGALELDGVAVRGGRAVRIEADVAPAAGGCPARQESAVAVADLDHRHRAVADPATMASWAALMCSDQKPPRLNIRFGLSE